MVDVFYTFHQLDVMLLPVKQYPFKIYTRATPGISLVVFNKYFYYPYSLVMWVNTAYNFASKHESKDFLHFDGCDNRFL